MCEYEIIDQLISPMMTLVFFGIFAWAIVKMIKSI